MDPDFPQTCQAGQTLIEDWQQERDGEQIHAAPANAQLDAAGAMVQWMSVEDAVGLAPQLPAPGVDSRLGAAEVILYAHGRQR